MLQTIIITHELNERWNWLLHRDSKKGCHPNHGRNFVNSWWICKIFSLLQRALNLQQNPY